MIYYNLDNKLPIPLKLADYLSYGIVEGWINTGTQDITEKIKHKQDQESLYESGYKLILILAYDDDGNFVKDLTDIYHLLV